MPGGGELLPLVVRVVPNLPVLRRLPNPDPPIVQLDVVQGQLLETALASSECNLLRLHLAEDVAAFGRYVGVVEVVHCPDLERVRVRV